MVRRRWLFPLTVAVSVLLASLLGWRAFLIPSTTPVAGAAPPACGGWNVVPSANAPRGLINRLVSVAAVSSQDVWAGGVTLSPRGGPAGGLNVSTLIERWDGSSWSIVPSPSPGSAVSVVQAVAATSRQDAWAVGYYDDPVAGATLTLIERWDGANWSVMPGANPERSLSSTNVLNGVVALSANNVWAVGTVAGAGATTSRTLIEHWNGSTWSVVSSPNVVGASSNNLVGVAATSAGDIWAVGSSRDASSGVSQTLIEHWNGSTWSIVSSPSAGSNDNYLFGVAAIKAGDIWAVGGSNFPTPLTSAVSQTLIEHWDGTRWSIVPSPSPGVQSNSLNGVTALSAGNVQAVGAFSSTGTSQTLIEQWDGTHWSVVPSPNAGSSENALAAVAALTPRDIWAVGSSGSPNQSLTEHACSPTPTRGRLVIIVEGISSMLTADQISGGSIPNFGTIVPYLQSHGWADAQFLNYSYTGSTDQGIPMPYSCVDTFNSPLSGDILTLHSQIAAYLAQHPNTDVYLIGHSLGGVIALGELANLESLGWSLPNGGSLRGVVTLDSPIGGVSNNRAYLQVVVAAFNSMCPDINYLGTLNSVADLMTIFVTAPDSHPQGGQASVKQGLFGGAALTNQQLVDEAFAHGTPVLTVGNVSDLMWDPSLCGVDGDFRSTQWVTDEAGGNVAVYARDFTKGRLQCFLPNLDKEKQMVIASHEAALNDASVERALIQFLPAGATPSALTVAPSSP